MTYIDEKTICLGKVDNIDVNGASKVGMILHAKVEPLQVAIAVGVIAHEDIESVLIATSHLLDIGTLHVAIKSYLVAQNYWLAGRIQGCLVHGSV